MSGLSTHILDTSSGKPAANLRVRLHREDLEICSVLTDSEGRCAALLPQGVPLVVGTYQLVFDIAAYFPNAFFPEVRIQFVVHDATARYHIPLLISPFSFTTYRGS